MADISGPLEFTRVAREKVGCQVPVGGKRRGVWYGRLKEEMEVQGWTWEDLEVTLEYVKRKHIRIKQVEGLLYFVEDARRDRLRQDGDIHVKVAEALLKEEDPGWRRRLSLARGTALERVYLDWKAAHEV